MDLSEDPTLKFSHPERSQRSRFCIYADFECALNPFDTVRPNPNPAPENLKETSKSTPTHVHTPFSYCYRIVDTENEFSETRLYRGENVGRHFMESIKDDVLHIGDLLYKNRQTHPVLTPDEEAAHAAATLCYLCGKGYTPEDVKVRDHSHSAPFSYRGAAHRSCNLRFMEQDTINVYFHNLSNYDAHFIVRELGFDQGDIGVVANTSEKYIGFVKHFQYKDARHGTLKLRFLDTFRFMSSSLAKLVDNLPKEYLKLTRKEFPDPEQFDLISRKGVFPYSYVTSTDVLSESQLPPKAAFKNDLTLEDISDPDYCHAQNVWRCFGIQDLGSYSDLYLLTDVLLLADVFESFRDMCLKEYNLDPAHYYTLPSYAWDAMLKMTGVVLDTIQDFDQYLFFEKGTRGGISQCCHRYAQANNKYCEGFDSTKPSEYITYLDANNLYGWAMSQSLPTGGFQWLSQSEIDELHIPSLADDGDKGFVFEVDLKYDPSIHDQHRDLPFCCESGIPPNGKFPKLLTSLTDKNSYIIHYRTLKQALDHGLKITKIHRVLSFNQSKWLEIYINHNTQLRKAARSEFEKDLFKLMNNAVFGKSMENVRKYVDMRLVCNEKKFEKLVARSTFVDRTYFSEDLALVHLEKVRVILNKPIYVGMCVLELSKWLMYDFHYKMLARYGPRIRLLYMDTDSLMYLIQSEDIYRDMESHSDDFDTSEYPEDHFLHSLKNKKTLGKFKDEASRGVPLEFIGLLSKLYCLTIAIKGDDDKIIKRAKGVSKAVVEKVLTVSDYRKCLFDNEKKYTKNVRFESHKHIVTTVEVNKLSLCPSDDKRYLLPDGISTLPHGHYKIPPPPQ